ncbi:hypothetical protein HW115_19220 [Verrucomicrobiaceae bacterium N1E253]|uniref:GRAM domain-containing protein n=1 Tax=Oceaniferula marina TaxID=2748318 RepID=A0A851GIX0_9BACT|nr:hypothetical protein [Oceaniferula marina]NWK57758.1 hypothetical protein [Oceaniferula marina]
MNHKIASSGLKQWAILGSCFALPMCIFFSLLRGDWILGIQVGILSGGLFATMMVWFSARQIKRLSVDRPDFEGADVIFEGPANHFKGAEGVGGYLWLTSSELFFKSHRFNIQNHECRMRLQDITSIDTIKTLGIIPNGLLVCSALGAKEKFVVNRNKDWATAIMRERENECELNQQNGEQVAAPDS